MTLSSEELGLLAYKAFQEALQREGIHSDSEPEQNLTALQRSSWTSVANAIINHYNSELIAPLGVKIHQLAQAATVISASLNFWMDYDLPDDEYEEMVVAGEKLTSLLKDCQKILSRQPKENPNNKSQYNHYIPKLVDDGFLQ